MEYIITRHGKEWIAKNKIKCPECGASYKDSFVVINDVGEDSTYKVNDNYVKLYCSKCDCEFIFIGD